jgi:hypothetical protein
MFLSSSGLPYSIYRIFVDHSVIVREDKAFRPDRLVRDIYGSSSAVEFFCNEASNVSPLSLSSGTEYLTPTAKFVKTFLEVP